MAIIVNKQEKTLGIFFSPEEEEFSRRVMELHGEREVGLGFHKGTKQQNK